MGADGRPVPDTTSSVDYPFSTSGSVNYEMKRKSSFSKLSQNASRDIPGQYDPNVSDPHLNKSNQKLWKLMESYLGDDTRSIQRQIVNHVEYTLARTRFNMDAESVYRATAYSVRDRLIESLNDTTNFFAAKDAKRVYYLSLEFLLGRALQNALVNMDLEDNYRDALSDLGYELEFLYEYERDPALGNGGLGRLAACFLDSMACLSIPGWGYGIRYTYGIFEQKLVDGAQVEFPDYWLVQGNPWEIQRIDCTYGVKFGGYVREYTDSATGRHVKRWVDGEILQAVAHDNPIPGLDTFNTINLRLWKAAPGKEFDFHLFNIGQYLESVRERQRAEYITAVLYPNDNSIEGKELRLKQQYFFVCATIQDILRRFKKIKDRDWDELPSKVAMQLNDTHPTIAIPELARILMDIEGLPWEKAWRITKQCFCYTNHTVLPEALEKWSVALFEHLLPRHLLIINDINFTFLNEVKGVFGDDHHKMAKMSIYEEGSEKRLRMANLAVMGSKHVNGVAAIHSELVKKDLFPEFKEFYDKKGETEKFQNVTNGVTPRRWIYCANPKLATIYNTWLKSGDWLKDLDALKDLNHYIDDPELHKQWGEMKLHCKQKLTNWVKVRCNVDLNPEKMLFDIQVKRIHEYKRQLMNCMYIIHRYLTLKSMSPSERAKTQARACIIGGKAAPGYKTAKTIIKLVTAIQRVVNDDKDVADYLKVVFLPNYNVSNAQTIIPANDLSQHISTAGTEASGTSNMKFVMNGGLIIGTLDGANIEIQQKCGLDTMFIFGAKEEQVAGIREKARHGDYKICAELMSVINYIKSGVLTTDNNNHQEFCGLCDQILNNGYGHNGDFYLLAYDFPDYLKAQALVDETYKDKKRWTTLTIKAATNMGFFSTDRSITDYCNNIWNVHPLPKPGPEPNARKNSFANDDPIFTSPEKNNKKNKNGKKDKDLSN